MMESRARFGPDLRLRARPQWWCDGPAWLVGLALLLALGSSPASAAAMGSLTMSVGLLSALAALFVIKDWPAHLPFMALSTGGSLILVAGAAWLWRARVADRVLGFTGTSGPSGLASGAQPGPVACPAVPAVITLPAGFEQASLLAELRLHFVRLQAAWDLGELPALRALTTPEMLDDLCREMPGCATDSASNRTDVVTLDARLLGFEELAGDFLVSVEFSGLIRESAERGAAPFRELWMFARAKQGASGWRLARHQAFL